MNLWGRLLIAWFLCCGCTFRVDGENPRRVWIGEKVTDWIDVGEIYRYLNHDFVSIYSDPSPIERVLVTERVACSFVISQKEATWLLESYSGRSADYTMVAISEPMKQMLYDYGKQIYPPLEETR